MKKATILFVWVLSQCEPCELRNAYFNRIRQFPYISLLRSQAPHPLIQCLTHAFIASHVTFTSPSPPLLVWVCVVFRILKAYVHVRVCCTQRDRQAHEHEIYQAPLILPVIYGSQIHVMLRLNKRSFVTDTSLWSRWIGFSFSLLHRICPALLLLQSSRGFVLTHFQHTCIEHFPSIPQQTLSSSAQNMTLLISLLWTCDPG